MGTYVPLKVFSHTCQFQFEEGPRRSGTANAALLQQGISEPEFHGDLVYRFRKIVENLTFRSNSDN